MILKCQQPKENYLRMVDVSVHRATSVILNRRILHVRNVIVLVRPAAKGEIGVAIDVQLIGEG